MRALAAEQLVLSGDDIALRKESTILSLRHTAETRFEADRVLQRHQFEATADLPLASFYSFVYSFSPKARNWLARPVEGALLRGEFNADKGNKPNQPVRWMAQYDPAIQKGVLLYYQQVYTGEDARCGFWDTDGYHKALAQPCKGVLVKGTKLD